jgi:hypothetical protein
LKPCKKVCSIEEEEEEEEEGQEKRRITLAYKRRRPKFNARKWK